jgi:hypothetical protein
MLAKVSGEVDFCHPVYQGVQCRSEGDPVLFIKDPEGMDRDLRKASIDAY